MPANGPEHTLRAPLPLLAVAFLGAMSALAGGYWDDAWHTERGRDSFFIAPHIAIYAGIAAAGAALTGWALLVAGRSGAVAVWRHRPLVLALISVALTLASGPIDNVWHVAFGRDAVIWSPPHMLGIAGTLGLGAAILAELATWPERWARSLTVVAGGLVLASAGFSTAEYDTDVPQFDEAFYLPVLGLTTGIGLLLVRLASDARWAATSAAVMYLGFMVAVGGFLSLVDFPPPALPLLLLPALVVDTAVRRRWSPIAGGLLFAVALHVSYVPVRNWLGDGVAFDMADVVLGGGLTAVAGIALFALARTVDGGWTPVGLPPSATAVALVAALLVPAVTAEDAAAHDPGQGEDAGSLALRLQSDGHDIRLDGRLRPADCTSTQAVAIVVRRAGNVLRAPLTATDCRIAGRLTVSGRGRWFVYAELRRAGRAVESWLPITVGDGSAQISDTERYAYLPPERSSGAIKVVGGIVLYAAMAGLVVAAFILVAGGRARPSSVS